MYTPSLLKYIYVYSLYLHYLIFIFFPFSTLEVNVIKAFKIVSNIVIHQ